MEKLLRQLEISKENYKQLGGDLEEDRLRLKEDANNKRYVIKDKLCLNI